MDGVGMSMVALTMDSGPSSGDLGVVHLLEDNYSGRTSPRCRECEGGLGVTPPDRLERLDTQPRDIYLSSYRP